MEIYHLINRAVERRNITLNDHDRVRFMHDLFIFNDIAPALHPLQPTREKEKTERRPLVSIHAFCLMQNHYHLLVSEEVEGGISFFMKKLNMGYTKYFNERYGRTGALWQGKYKKVLIERDAHFLYIPFYIHLNPLDYSMPEWREGKIRAPKQALQRLLKYKWSSHLDYSGVKNFPSIIRQDLLKDILGTRKKYEQRIIEIITSSSLAEKSYLLE